MADSYGILAWKAPQWTARASKNIPSQLPNDGVDVYFSVNRFSHPKRRNRLACPGVWLHADLDDVDPRGLSLSPTVAWRSSPGRYQALWLLDKALDPRKLAELNRALAYRVDADRGTWDLSRVLRIPGTINAKYPERPRVKLLWDDGPEHKVADLTTELEPEHLVTTREDYGGAPTNARLDKRKIPKKLRATLNAKRASGDRSIVLSKLYSDLHEAGLSHEEVFLAVRNTVWNKWPRRPQLLWDDVCRVIEKRSKLAAKKPSKKSLLPEEKLREFLTREIKAPDWMVDGIWSEGAVGLIAGEPKTYKSTIAMDLAMSVATGTKFLNHFEVPTSGPVLLIQEENEPALMYDRLHRMAHARGVGPSANGNEISFGEDVPLTLVNNYGFSLVDKKHRQLFQRTVDELRPTLVVLDPLYLMTPGVDESSAHDMTPILKYLLRVKQAYGCGILVLHHYRKKHIAEGAVNEGGQRISGTSVFHRWLESAMYLEKTEEVGAVRITTEHRAQPPGEGVEVGFIMAGDIHYHTWVERKRDEKRQEYQEIIELVEKRPGISVVALAKRFGCNKATIRRKVKRLGLRVGRAPVPQGKVGRPRLGVYPASAKRGR